VLVTGIGYDSHKLVLSKPLIIGGVKIDYIKGSLAHSDGDVLVHAIIDSILGASGNKDIGTMFPDTDDKYKNISSLVLLNNFKNYKIIYIDSVILLEKPKLSTYLPLMKENIAKTLNISIERVNIKAKSNENMGFVGRAEGIASYAVCTLDREFV